MQLETALLEFAYSKDHSPTSRHWYRSRLRVFTDWLREQSVTEIDGITAPLVRRYIDFRRTATSRTGQPLDSHTLHGHARTIKTLLRWAALEGLIDEWVSKRITMPRKAEKLLPVLTADQVRRLMLASDQSGYAPQSHRA